MQIYDGAGCKLQVNFSDKQEGFKDISVFRRNRLKRNGYRG